MASFVLLGYPSGSSRKCFSWNTEDVVGHGREKALVEVGRKCSPELGWSSAG